MVECIVMNSDYCPECTVSKAHPCCNANKLWSTIEHPTPVNLLELLNECSVKLVYLGQLRFGELKTHPRKPSIPMPIKSSTKKSTEEPAGQNIVQTDINAPTSLENR